MWWLYNENRQFCPCSLRIYFCQSIIPAGSRDYRFLNPGSGIGKRDPGLQSLLSTHYRLRPYPVIVAIRPRTHGSSSPHLASSSAMTILPTLTSATSLPIGLPSWSWDWTRLIMLISLLPAIRSLEGRARQGRRSHRSWRAVMTPHFSRQRGTGGHNLGIIHMHCYLFFNKTYCSL